MKKLLFISTFLFIYGLVFPNGQVFKQKAEIELSDLIKKIEKKYDISITYESDISFKLTNKQVATVLNKKSPEDALKEVVRKRNLTFKKIRNEIFEKIIR